MQESNNCILTLKSFEDLRLSPHFDTLAGIWDIGYGTTHYPDGTAVTGADRSITEDEANDYLLFYVNKAVNCVNANVICILNQNQFDALVIFTYNVGIEAFRTSTLLKVINKDPTDYFNIQKEWMRWVYSNGQKVTGLINRRNGEFDLYTS